MKYGIFLLFLALSVATMAQPQHVGGLVNVQFEGSSSGNGTIVGIELQSVEHLRIKGQEFKLATNATITADKKVYRSQFGGAVRATSVLRYALPIKVPFVFIEAGGQIGGIAFPNTPGASDGYVKYIARPVVGAGFDFTRAEWSVTTDYQFQFKRKLFSQGLPVRVGASVLDGWTSGQRVGLASTIRISDRWLLLVNGAAGWYSYQRNPAQYGSELGAVIHRFNAYELSVGVGRRYGK